MSEPEDVPLPLEKIRQRHIRRWFIIVVVIQSVFLIILYINTLEPPNRSISFCEKPFAGNGKKGYFSDSDSGRRYA